MTLFFFEICSLNEVVCVFYSRNSSLLCAKNMFNCVTFESDSSDPWKICLPKMLADPMALDLNVNILKSEKGAVDIDNVDFNIQAKFIST